MKINCILVLIGLVQMAQGCFLAYLWVANLKAKKALSYLKERVNANTDYIFTPEVARGLKLSSPIMRNVYETVMAMYDKKIIGDDEREKFEDLIFHVDSESE